MKKNLMFLALAAIGLASCNGGYKKGENGILYNKYTDKPGPKVQQGDFVLLNMTIKNDADSILFSSYESDHPQPLILQKPDFKGDMFDGIKLLAEGDSASIKIDADSIFKRATRPPGFKGKSVIYDIKVEKLIAKGKMTDQVFQETVTKFMAGQAEVQKKSESSKIKKYIDDKKLVMTKTDSGLYYTITKKGSGPLPTIGDTVVVNYIGSLFSGRVFDTNVKEQAVKDKTYNSMRPYTPIRVPVGVRRVIAGWDQGLQLLNKGSKATFVIPSILAYGEQGNGPIGPFTPLAFDIEVLDIVHAKLVATKPGETLPPVKSVPLKK